MWDPNNMFLNGPYAPWREECVAFDLEIEGELPTELGGALFQTSASQHYRPIDPVRHHWFDGDGVVYAVYPREGRATFQPVRGHGRTETGDEGRSGHFRELHEQPGEPRMVRSRTSWRVCPPR